MKRPYGRWIFSTVFGMLCVVVVYAGVLIALQYFGYSKLLESDLFSYSLLGVMILIFLLLDLPRRPKD